ncbi:hypothetical protein QBC47DRAFT_62307 [Echria macrotheca]|uniref:Uncharacterized protein n=1 Tax=Echria macrotheca TaxID=438768 RepID=A0AAJ0F930_9PEZI|nr:hypothetical protein QBC47DRAFT_62307 [Echria macrotheca]
MAIPIGRTVFEITGDNLYRWRETVAEVTRLMRCVRSYPDDQEKIDAIQFELAQRKSRGEEPPENWDEWYDANKENLVRPSESSRAEVYYRVYRGKRWGEEDRVQTRAPPAPKSVSAPQSLARFAGCPQEIRDLVWLETENTRKLVVLSTAVCYTKAMDVVLEACWSPRSWEDIKLYQICSESRQLAIREFGGPAPLSIPFRPAADAVNLSLFQSLFNHSVVEGHISSDASFAARVLDGFGGLKSRLPPIAERPPIFSLKGPWQLVSRGHTLRVDVSDDLRSRIRQVSIPLDGMLRLPATREEAESEAMERLSATKLPDLQYNCRQLVWALRDLFPRLETLVLEVDPVDDGVYTNPSPRFRYPTSVGEDGYDYDPETQDVYTLARLFFVEALAQLRSEPGPNGSSTRDENKVPFPHLKRIIVDTSAYAHRWTRPRPTRKLMAGRMGTTQMFGLARVPRAAAPRVANAKIDLFAVPEEAFEEGWLDDFDDADDGADEDQEVWFDADDGADADDGEDADDSEDDSDLDVWVDAEGNLAGVGDMDFIFPVQE